MKGGVYRMLTKSFATDISTSLIDRQEKVVIQDCLLLPASVLLYGYLSGISFLFYPAFPPKN